MSNYTYEQLLDLLAIKQAEIERLEKRVESLETALVESPVPPGKYAHVADKRRRKAEATVTRIAAHCQTHRAGFIDLKQLEDLLYDR